MYKTGIETKQNILNCSRKLFYEQGYRKTGVEQICRASNTKLGTFTYYYPKKHDLLYYLYTEYMQKCINFVEAYEKNLTPSRHHLYAVIMYYGNLYADEKIISFHREVMETVSMNVWFVIPRMLISGYSGLNHDGLDDAEYELCVKADNAARRELNLEFISRGEFSGDDILGLMHRIYMVNARLFQVPQNQMEEDLEAAWQFYCRHRDVAIRLLY